MLLESLLTVSHVFRNREGLEINHKIRGNNPSEEQRWNLTGMSIRSGQIKQNANLLWKEKYLKNTLIRLQCWWMMKSWSCKSYKDQICWGVQIILLPMVYMVVHFAKVGCGGRICKFLYTVKSIIWSCVSRTFFIFQISWLSFLQILLRWSNHCVCNLGILLQRLSRNYLRWLDFKIN